MSGAHAATVSRQLRQAGFPMGRNGSYTVEGVKVRQRRHSDTVVLVCDFDSDLKAERVALLALQTLREMGYRTAPVGNHMVYVTRPS